MTFFEALAEYHKGKWIKRKYWKGRVNGDWGGDDETMFISPHSEYINDENEASGSGFFVDWEDLLANDWIALDKE